jgi:hypothetical protein
LHEQVVIEALRQGASARAGSDHDAVDIDEARIDKQNARVSTSVFEANTRALNSSNARSRVP